jgi:hypothetical protein
LKKKISSVSQKKATSPRNPIPTELGPEGKPKKVTVSLALDDNVVAQIRKQAATMDQSFNARVNTILEKYVSYYAQTEIDRLAMIPRSLHQFFINEIDEAKYTARLKQIGVDITGVIFIQTGMAKTLDNLVKFVFEGLCVNSGSIRSVKKYVDEDDGKTCLYFVHDYDLRWSRILSSGFEHLIQTLLNYHTSTKVFPESFEIKIIEKDPQ